MKVNREVIGKMVHNVLSYEFDKDGRLCFQRFSPSQKKVYRAESESFFMKTNASSSVTLDFVSDSEYLVLKFELYESEHVAEGADFDLYVDGIFYESRYLESLDINIIGFDLPKGEHRVTLYFPWNKETVVNEIHLSEHSSVKEVQKKAKVLSLGDSITQGSFTRLTSLSYVSQLANHLDVEILNQGIGGYVFWEKSIDESIVSYAPDLITIAYGTNDYTRYDHVEDYQKNVSNYMEKLTTLFPNTKILAIMPIYRNDFKHQAREKYRDYKLEDARKILRTIYQKYPNVQVMEETEIPRIPEAYARDFLHPNDLGFTFMTWSIEKQINNLLL